MRHLFASLQPAWTVLADITSWFNWEALSALGTVGALWFVVIQSTRSGRAERAKNIGVLTYLIGLIEPVENVSIYEDSDEERLKKVPGSLVDDDLSAIRRAMTGLAALPLSEAAAVNSVEWVMALPLALKDIEHALQSRSISSKSSVLSSIRYTQEAVSYLRKKRDRLQYGFLECMVRRTFHNMEFFYHERKLRKTHRRK